MPGDSEDGVAHGDHGEQVTHRHAGRFFDRTMLPSDTDTDTDKAGARMKDGVLTIRLPKAKQAARRLQIRG